MKDEWKSEVENCWCETEHTNPFTELGHLILTELKIPELAEWLDRQLKRI